MELGGLRDQQHHACVSQQAHQVDGQEDEEEGQAQVPAVRDAQEDELSRGHPQAQVKFSGVILQDRVWRETKQEGGEESQDHDQPERTLYWEQIWVSLNCVIKV